MDSKSDGKMDEHANYWAATDGSSQGSTVAQPARSETSRSITPKGTLFPNLGEAHQAITSKLASQSAGNHIPEEESLEPLPASVSNVSSSTASVLSARKMEFIKPNRPPQQRCLTPFFGTTSRNLERNKKPANTGPVDSSSATQFPGSDLIRDHPSISTGEHSTGSEPLASGNRIGQNDSQYSMPSSLAAEISSSAELSSSGNAHQDQTLGSVSPLSDKALHRPIPRIKSVNPRSPEIHRANTSISPGKHLWDLRHPSNGTPQRSLPELQNGYGGFSHSAWEAQASPLKFGRPSVSFQDVSNLGYGMIASLKGTSGGLPTASPGTSIADHPSSPAFPRQESVGGRPLPFPPLDDLKDRFDGESESSQDAASNHRLSTDSDEDPFKYDKGSFSVLLRPSREREVSAALRCVSGDSTVSARALFQHATPSPDAAPRRAARSTNPFVNGLRSYQTSTLEYDWDYEEDPSEFKISVRSPPVPSSPPAEPTLGLSQVVRRPENPRRLQDGDYLLSKGPDWEAFAASAGQLASAGQFDSNRAVASSTGLSCSRSAQVGGSSIADCSDSSSVHAPEHNAFSSRERILRHPATDYTPGARNPRTLEHTGRPVFVPKPRIHRVNGYLHNSQRVFTDPTAGSSGNSTRSALVEKLSASIRSRSERKRAIRLLQQAEQERSRSQFQSLGSISSEYSEESCELSDIRMAGTAHAGGHAANHSTARQARPVRPAGNVYGGQNGHKPGSGLLASPFPKEPSRAHLKGRNSPAKLQIPANEQFGLGSPTLFNFPLISLEEAAQRAALNRDLDDNLTVTSGVRTRKNSSMDSSKGTQRTTPPTPHLMKPGRIHSYRPSSASILGIPVADRGGYISYSQERIAMGHDRGISNVTSYKSRTPLVPGHRAPSQASRTPFDYPIVGGGSSIPSSSSRHPFSGTPSIFRNPPRLVPRDRRPTTTLTAVTAAANGRTSTNTHRAPPTVRNLTPHHHNTARTMASDLRQIATMETSHHRFSGSSSNPSGFLATGEDGLYYLSWEARQRREAFYYLMCALCVLPFTAPLVYAGTADSALSWYTRGEVASLTRRQRRNVLRLGGVLSVLWFGVLVGFVVYLVLKKVGVHA